MNNININNSLAELEDNLKKMDSARTQVSTLAILIGELTDAYSNILLQLTKIENSIHYDEQYFKKKFGKSIDELDQNINLLKSKVIDYNKKVDSIQEKASEDFISSLNKSEEKLKTYIDEIGLVLEKNKNDFKNTNEEFLVDLKKKVKGLVQIISERIDEIKGLDLAKEIKNIDLSLSNLDVEFQIVLKALDDIDTKLVLDFEKLENENKKLTDQIRKLSVESNSNFKISLVAILLVLIAVVVLKFV